MITVPVMDWWVICCFAGYGSLWAMISTARWSWEELQSWAERRVERRLKPDAWRKKFLRHAKSGRVGLCVGSGFGKHRWLGWLRAEERIEFVRCAGCAKGILEPMPRGIICMMVAKSVGHVEILPAREMVAALSQEIEAFRAAMEKAEPEASE